MYSVEVCVEVLHERRCRWSDTLAGWLWCVSLLCRSFYSLHQMSWEVGRYDSRTPFNGEGLDVHQFLGYSLRGLVWDAMRYEQSGLVLCTYSFFGEHGQYDVLIRDWCVAVIVRSYRGDAIRLCNAVQWVNLDRSIYADGQGCMYRRAVIIRSYCHGRSGSVLWCVLLRSLMYINVSVHYCCTTSVSSVAVED